MRIAGAIACLLLLIPSVGSTGRTSASIRPLLGKYWDTAALLPFRRTAYEYASKGQMLEAAKAYERAYREAMRLGDKRSAIRFMNNAGACRLDLLQYREAMSALLLTRKMAEAAGDDKVARTSTLNLSNLYLQMGDLKAAVEAAQRGLGGLPASEFSISRIHALIQLGLIRSRQGDLPASEKLFQDAIAMAERSGEVPALGRAWNHLGYEYLEHNLLNQAEIALGNAHRILSAKTDSETYLCFPNLGRLYLRKGDLKEASKWMDLSVEASRNGGKQLPAWYVYQYRGLVRLAQGKYGLALEDFRRALQSARLWRLDIVPANSLRVSSEVKLQKIYDSFLTSGYAVYRKNPSQKLLAELFLAAEENRAWSLRQTLREGLNPHLPEEYFELLAQMRSAASRMLSANTSSREGGTIVRLRSRMTEMEASAGLQLPVIADENMALSAIQTRLQLDEAFLSFHLSGETPLLFTLTHDRLTIHPLAGQAEVGKAILRLRQEIGKDGLDAEGAAKDAYQLLLGDLTVEVRGKRHWLLALDASLFELPFAALRTGNSYLIEKHSLTITPHVSMRVAAVEVNQNRSFLGFGDPVYNRSDKRWQGPRQMFGDPWVGREIFELSRLPGTGLEIDRCGRRLGGRAVQIKGADATAERLAKELRLNPAIIHLAAHVIQSKEDSREAMIALSLRPDGASSLLTRESIAGLRTNAAVVTLSGCGSGVGEVLPGAGLMGLTRAWLTAGAHSVAANLWPVPDDDGELLYSFYRALRSPNASASDALQAAQIANLHSGSWRSNPRYWAAYFIAGKD